MYSLSPVLESDVVDNEVLNAEVPLPASFRDPSGYVFKKHGVVYRRVQPEYEPLYRKLMDSGLYPSLVEAQLLLPHEEAGSGILRPEQLSFVSYPYEWSFGQWKDAALATLAIQIKALAFGMCLKDASAFNIQFHHGKPVLIDTLSFEEYHEGEPWIAYRQFCEHFLAPLALMAHTDIRLGSLFRTYMDGIPLSLAAKLLPWKDHLNLPILAHIYMQARFQEQGSQNVDTKTKDSQGTVSLAGLRALLDNLHSAIAGLNWEPTGTVWADYYNDTNYTSDAMQAKERLVAHYLERASPIAGVWDFGANDARFSRLASSLEVPTVAFDIDPAAVEQAYQRAKKQKDMYILPLLTDLTNPSPDQGWAHTERMSLASRGPVDVVFALALIHHLAISCNIPLSRIADYFATVTKRCLIIEWVPKSDSQTMRLLTSRRDIFTHYTQEDFELAFARHFEILENQVIPATQRTLYLLQRKAK